MLISEKAQIFENTQFLYHENLSLSQNRKDNIPDRDQSLAVTSNGTGAEIGIGAGIIYQRDAPSDLKMVSWAPDHPSRKLTSYAYDSEGGGQATIYLIENGIDGRNSVNYQWSPHELVPLLTPPGIYLAPSKLALCSGRYRNRDR